MPDECFVGVNTIVSTSPCGTVVPTTMFDPSAPSGDDPVYSSGGPNCTPGTGDGVECALIDGEQQHTVEPGDGLDHVLLVDDIVLIPPYPHDGVITSAPTTTTQP